MKSKILVTGGGGMLARDLKTVLSGRGLDVIAPSRTQLDITNRSHVEGIVATLRPAAVFNCAAFTKVDLSESDPRAAEVNDVAVGAVASACRKFGSRLIQVSTDFVFDGRKREPYTEGDPTNPLSAYGRTKRAGEERALEVPGSLVVRASWLFGNGGPNFVEAMLKQTEEGKSEVRVVTDQAGRPTATPDLAEALVRLFELGTSGIVHFANRGEVTWHEFAKEIFRQSGHSDVVVSPMTSQELNRPAVRPAYSVLATEKFEKLTGKSPRDFREALAEYLERRRK